MDKSLILDGIKEHLGFSKDSELASFLGIARNTLSTWRSRNSIDYDLIISKCDQIDANWLITGKGNMLKDDIKQHSPVVLEPDYQHRVPQVITVDSHNHDNIALVPLKLKAGYLEGYNDPSFIKKLPTFRVPGLNNGIFRMFEIEGNSMFPTLPDRTHVIGQFVENWVRDIKDDQLYAIISNEVEDGLVKRCLNRIEKYNNLICKSDNRRNYPTQNLDPRTIKEIWEIKLHLNWQLPNPADIYDRMNDFEAELQQIKSRLK
ncbi:LexA family transcriptional regulator [Elizabethkingia anophelis]|uniref:LexA family transcriptional regulator n=1 Tax=Elizabethkingia anophelis TaxID=1117645 RepID=UPI003891D758